MRKRLRFNDERGAQAAEYAMLGGVSAAACGAMVVLLKSPNTIERVVSTVINTVSRFIGSWF